MGMDKVNFAVALGGESKVFAIHVEESTHAAKRQSVAPANSRMKDLVRSFILRFAVAVTLGHGVMGFDSPLGYLDKLFWMLEDTGRKAAIVVAPGADDGACVGEAGCDRIHLFFNKNTGEGLSLTGVPRRNNEQIH